MPDHWQIFCRIGTTDSPFFVSEYSTCGGYLLPFFSDTTRSPLFLSSYTKILLFCSNYKIYEWLFFKTGYAMHE